MFGFFGSRAPITAVPPPTAPFRPPSKGGYRRKVVRRRRHTTLSSPLQSKIKIVMKRITGPKNVRISADAKVALAQCIHTFALSVARLATDLRRETKKKTISAREIQTATRLILTRELSRHAISEGVKAITRFCSSSSRGNKAKRAGLVFSPSYFRKMLKEQCFNTKIASAAPIYLSAVAEYIAAEVIELAAKTIGGRTKRITIKTRNLMFAVRHDDELNRLYHQYSFKLAGVPTNVHYALMKKPSRAAAKPAQKKPRTLGRAPMRFRPGTVALRLIRKMQKSGDLLSTKASWKRTVNQHLEDLTNRKKKTVLGDDRRTSAAQTSPLKLSQQASIKLQEAAQIHLIKILSMSNLLAIHQRRTTVKPIDVDIVLEHLKPGYLASLRGGEQ